MHDSFTFLNHNLTSFPWLNIYLPPIFSLLYKSLQWTSLHFLSTWLPFLAKQLNMKLLDWKFWTVRLLIPIYTILELKNKSLITDFRMGYQTYLFLSTKKWIIRLQASKSKISILALFAFSKYFIKFDIKIKSW